MPFGFLSRGRPKGASKRIGGVHIDATLDASGAEAGLDQLEQKTKTTTTEVDRSFSGMTERMQVNVSKQTGVILGLIGAVTAVIGVFTTFFAIGKKVGDMLAGTAEAARLSEAALEDLGKQAARSAKLLSDNLPPDFAADTAAEMEQMRVVLREGLDKLDAELVSFGERGAITGFFDEFIGLGFEEGRVKLRAQLEEAHKEARDLQAQTNDLIARGKAQAADDELAAFIALNDAKMNADRALLEGTLRNIETAKMAEQEANAETFKKKLQDQQKFFAEQARGEAAAAQAFEKAITAGIGRVEAQANALMNRLTVAAEQMAISVEQVKRRSNP